MKIIKKPSPFANDEWNSNRLGGDKKSKNALKEF